MRHRRRSLYEPVGLWLPAYLVPPALPATCKAWNCRWIMAARFRRVELIALPPCKMMVFQGEPYDDAVFETLSRKSEAY